MVAQTVKTLPVVPKTRVQSLGQEGPLEKGMAIHCSILAWKIPWTEELCGLQTMDSQKVRHDGVTNTFSPLKSFLMVKGRNESLTCILKLENMIVIKGE